MRARSFLERGNGRRAELDEKAAEAVVVIRRRQKRLDRDLDQIGSLFSAGSSLIASRRFAMPSFHHIFDM